MEDTTYNGWTNRATWLVALWMGQEDFVGQQQLAHFSAVDVSDVRQSVMDWVSFRRHFRSEVDYGFIPDMEGEAFSSINYDELAEYFADDINAVFEEG